jgi:hypothetical protein
MTSQPITELVLQTEAILRLAVKAKLPIKSADVAEVTGLDGGSARRDLRRMADAGLLSIDGEGARGVVLYVPTASAHDAIEALDRAAGQGPATGLPLWPHDKFRRNPNQPRKTFPDEMISDRAESIVQVGGLLYPLIADPADASGVRMIQDGECRWRAVRLLIEQDRLPDSLKAGLPYTENAAGEAEMLKVALIANAQRSDLTPWEDAQGLKRLKDLLGLSARGVALATGRAKEGSERGVKDVQEKIKTADEAKPTNIALHESGVWSWEQLRESVRTAKTPPDAPAPAEPVQVDLVEAVAAATPSEEIDPDVIVAVLEIAHRASQYPGPASALGPTSNITDFINPNSAGSRYPLAVSLAAGGYALFVHSYPQHVVLLRPGADLVKRFAETPDQLDAAITTALRDAGVEEGDIDDLDREGKYQTEWLNVPPPPKPTEISDEEALVLLELYDAWKREGGGGYTSGPAYYGARVQPTADRTVLKALEERKFVKVRLDEPQKDGSVRVEPSTYSRPNCEEALKGRWPEIGKAGERTKALYAIRSIVAGQAEAEACKKDKRYTTTWLNGPFEISPEIQAKLDEEVRRKDQSERDRRAQQARDTAAAERREADLRALEVSAPTLSLAELGAKIAALLDASKSPTPYSPITGYSYGAFAKDAQTRQVSGDGPAKRAAILALNALTGRWPEVEEEQVTAMVFERWIAETLTEDHGVDSPSIADECASKALKRELEEQGVNFGSDTVEWDRDYAHEIAALWAQDFIDDGQVIKQPSMVVEGPEGVPVVCITNAGSVNVPPEHWANPDPWIAANIVDGDYVGPIEVEPQPAAEPDQSQTEGEDDDVAAA